MRRFCAHRSIARLHGNPALLGRLGCNPLTPWSASPTTMDTRSDQSNEDFWVFAYGSLMWRPGFDFLERRNARTG